MTLKNHLRAALSTFAMAAVLAAPAMAGQSGKTTLPDFTKGGKIPARATHDWNLGATGLRGWIFCDELVTSDARQIAITKVDKDSPAELMRMKAKCVRKTILAIQASKESPELIRLK